mmetsp:Transcript_5563/g.10575  ORF Transcript_5563/g.10575 Transcript_5563/m.10575 type:complete len:232 (-) Transcript_5563:165-860(-)
MVTSPECEVISQQLHNESRILVRLFIKSIKFCDGIIKRRLGNRASAIRRVENLIVKHREVESQSETNRMCRGQFSRSNSRCGSVSVKSRRCASLTGTSSLELGEVTVIISLHLVIEHLGFFRSRVRDETLLNDSEDIIANLNELGLDFRLVVLDDGLLVGFSLLLNGGNNTPGSAAGSNHILVGDGEKVALFDGEFHGLLGYRLHIFDHFIEALSLLGELCLVYEGVTIHG